MSDRGTLDHLSKNIQAGPFGTQLHKTDYVEVGIPMLNAKNIGQGEVSTYSLDYVSEKTCKRLPQYILQKGDIVFGRSGTINRHVCINDEYAGAFQGTNCIRVRLKDISLANYVSYYLHLESVKKKISLSAGKTTQQYITADNLAQISISVPSEKVVKNIERILITFDHKIYLNDAINAELEKAAKLLYNYWFVQFDFPDADSKPYRTSGGAMVWNEQLKREIPKGWRVDKLENKLNMQRGVEPGSDAYSEVETDVETVPFIRVSDLGSQPALFISEENANGTRCISNDVLVSFDGSVGKMAIAMEGAYSSGIRKISPKDCDYADALIYFIFQSEEIQKTIAKYAVGSNILHAAGAIEHLLFPYGQEVVNDFIAKVAPMYKQIVANHQQNKELAKLRDFLLPLLMNGQVTVGQAQDEANITPFKSDVADDTKYQAWKTKTGLAARGSIDEQTLRNIYEAMDADDR